MNKIILTAAIAITLWSCSTSKPFSGTVTNVNGAIITIDSSTRINITQGHIPTVGTKATFIPTRDRSKVNAKIISNER